jgi:type VI secretion system protein ImpE
LRDLVWLPAEFTWVNGGEAVGLIPVRYPGSEASTDDALRLSRKTEWVPLGESGFAGRGQRMLATNAAEMPLLDVREIALRAHDS